MCNGSWFQLLYHVMPFQAVLFLIFADHHFLIAAVLAIALTVLLLLLSIALNNHQKRRPRTRREQWVEDTIRRRLSVLLTFAVLLIPSGIAWFQYDMQSVQYWADQSSLSAPDGDSDSEAAWPESAAPLLRSFEEERWKSLSIRERTDALQRLSTLEATRLGVDPPTVTVLKLSPFILGSHKMTVNLIQLDLQHVTEDPAENVLYTCLHETFHSFQDYVIQNTDWDSPLAASAYFEKARAWKANSEFYVSSNLNYDAYLTQPLEEDANAFAKEETALLLSVLSDQS